MVELSRSIKVSTPSNKTFEILKDLAKFPQFISGVEQIQTKELDNQAYLNTWRINMQGMDISWEEEEKIDDVTRTVVFERVSGAFDVLKGVREVRETKDGSEISLSLKIDWSTNKRIDNKTIEKKADLALRWMLRSIRERLDAESILQYEHTGKHNRTVVSELVKYKNIHNKYIVGFIDYLKPFDATRKFILLPAGYGETKRDSITISYYLVSNGFNVLRYDNTDHLGESEGEIFYTTLSRMKDDIISSLNYIENRFDIKKVAVFGSSLSKRIALKAASEDPRICFLLGLVGIVNLKATLNAVYNLDIIGKVEAKEEEHVDTAEILGHEVSREFARSAISDNYHDIESTKNDIKKLNIPFVFIVAEEDEWVRLEDVEMVFESASHSNKELFVMQDTMHLIYENPKAAKSVMKQAIISCKKYLLDQVIDEKDVIDPGLREIASQNKVEKVRLRRLTEITKETEKEFWKSYLNKYILITKSKDFRNLLSLTEILLGAPTQNEVILDAGCGNGHFGAWLLWVAAARQKELKNTGAIIRRKYIGVDFVQEALNDAKTNHESIQGKILKDLDRDGKQNIIDFQYMLQDLEKRLPFDDNSFDKICCNLVLSYLKNSFFTLKELYRVLKPGGRMVVSSLKPHPDLSHIYRSFVKQSADRDEINEARLLLGAAGKIKTKEGQGYYVFFSERQLKSMFSRLRAVNVKDYRALADQAVVIASEKPQI